MIGTAILLAILACSLWYYLFRRVPRLSHLPGPRGWPLVGNMLQLDMIRPHLTMADWARQYGDVYVLRFINENWVFLNSLEAINEMLVKKGADYSGKALTYRTALYSNNGRGIAFQAPTAEWKALKTQVHKGIRLYSTDGKTKVEGILGELLEDFLVKLNAHGGQTFDIRPELYRFMIKSALTMIAGIKIDDDDRLFKMVEEMDRLSAKNLNFAGDGFELDLIPWLRYVGNKAYKELGTVNSLMNDFWNGAFPSLKERFENNERSCIVHNMMEAFSADVKPLTPALEYNLKSATKDVITGGTITTTTTLYQLFCTLLHHPDVKAKLQAEIDREIGTSRMCRLDDKEHMPYTSATILEILRFTTLLPLGTAHKALTDSSIRGHAIPRGTNIVMNMWHLNHDESFWKNPFQFQPERFLDPATGQLVPPDHENRKHVGAFGAGIRACPGESFAMARLFLVATAVLQRFDLVRADDGQPLPSCDPRTFGLGIVVYQQPYKLRLLHR